jgi:hypothetical protein
MLANPAGIILGAGLLGLAGYGGYKIFTKAILPQLKGEGFSFAEAKRQEAIDNVIEKMTSSEDSSQKLRERFDKIEPTRVSLVGSGSRQLASSTRAGNAAEIRLTRAPAALTGLEIKNIETSVPSMLTAPNAPLPASTGTEKQSSGTEQTEEEKQKQSNKLAQSTQSLSSSGEAQTAAHQYNQQVIHQAHIALNEQLINAYNKQLDAIKKLNTKIDEIIAAQNSKEPSIVTP